MKRTIAATRFRIAAVVLLAMVMTILSPLWHDQCLDQCALEAAQCGGPAELQGRDAGNRLSQPLDACSICQCQRLLNQVQAESFSQLSSHEEISSLVLEHLLPVAVTLAFTAQARSPPRG